ncbi:hypothetical protein K2X33_15985 [bacterium]|nr:hypothetical protein [bacterium]
MKKTFLFLLLCLPLFARAPIAPSKEEEAAIEALKKRASTESEEFQKVLEPKKRKAASDPTVFKRKADRERALRAQAEQADNSPLPVPPQSPVADTQPRRLRTTSDEALTRDRDALKALAEPLEKANASAEAARVQLEAAEKAVGEHEDALREYNKSIETREAICTYLELSGTGISAPKEGVGSEKLQKLFNGMGRSGDELCKKIRNMSADELQATDWKILAKMVVEASEGRTYQDRDLVRRWNGFVQMPRQALSNAPFMEDRKRFGLVTRELDVERLRNSSSTDYLVFVNTVVKWEQYLAYTAEQEKAARAGRGTPNMPGIRAMPQGAQPNGRPRL